MLAAVFDVDLTAAPDEPEAADIAVAVSLVTTTRAGRVVQRPVPEGFVFRRLHRRPFQKGQSRPRR